VAFQDLGVAVELAELGQGHATGHLALALQAGLEVVVGAVVGVPRLDDHRALGDVAREFDREHRRLGARVREAHLLGSRHAPAQLLGELHLRVGGARPGAATRERDAQRVFDRAVGVSVHQAQPVAEEVDVAVAVDVVQRRAAAVVEHDRVRREPAERAREPARHRLRRARHPAGRVRRQAPVLQLDRAHLALRHPTYSSARGG
jgi:hypothetical protein